MTTLVFVSAMCAFVGSVVSAAGLGMSINEDPRTTKAWFVATCLLILATLGFTVSLLGR